MTLSLAEPETLRMALARARQHHNPLYETINERLLGEDLDVPRQRVLASRRGAYDFLAAHPEVKGRVELDCRWVSVISGSYVAEILSAWPEAVFMNCNEDVAETIRYVRKELAR